MSERDELAGIIYMGSDLAEAKAARLADDVIAAGYRKPRTVTTAAELDALPVGTVVLVKQPEDVRGYSYQQGPSGRWYGAAASIGALAIQLMFPGSTATVLHEGEK